MPTVTVYPEMAMMTVLDDLKDHMTDQSYLSCCTMLRRIYVLRENMSRLTLSPSAKRHLRRLFRNSARAAASVLDTRREMIALGYTV